jgi:hypothetical protein
MPKLPFSTGEKYKFFVKKCPKLIMVDIDLSWYPFL